MLAADLAGRTASVRHSAVPMGPRLGVLRSLDTVPTTAYFSSFSGSMFHAIKLIAGRVRVMG